MPYVYINHDSIEGQLNDRIRQKDYELSQLNRELNRAKTAYSNLVNMLCEKVTIEEWENPNTKATEIVARVIIQDNRIYSASNCSKNRMSFYTELSRTLAYIIAKAIIGRTKSSELRTSQSPVLIPIPTGVTMDSVFDDVP